MTGDEVREWRRERGLRQIDLADHLGVTERTIQRWEAAETTPPPFLADALSKGDRS